MYNKEQVSNFTKKNVFDAQMCVGHVHLLQQK